MPLVFSNDGTTIEFVASEKALAEILGHPNLDERGWSVGDRIVFENRTEARIEHDPGGEPSYTWSEPREADLSKIREQAGFPDAHDWGDLFQQFRPVSAPRRRYKAVLALIALCAVVAVYWWLVVVPAQRATLGVSCANHAIHFKTVIMSYMDDHDTFPATTDAVEAFSQMMGVRDPRQRKRVEWNGCPKYMARGEYGYEFVAAGLPTKLVAEQKALIWFCPRDHNGGQHYHAHRGEYDLCLTGDEAMTAVLEQALSLGKSGVVPYTAEAMAIIEEHLRVREARGPQ